MAEPWDPSLARRRQRWIRMFFKHAINDAPKLETRSGKDRMFEKHAGALATTMNAESMNSLLQKNQMKFGFFVIQKTKWNLVFCIIKNQNEILIFDYLACFFKNMRFIDVLKLKTKNGKETHVFKKTCWSYKI